MNKIENEIGISYSHQNYKIFFGNINFTEEKLIDITVQSPIQFMKQTHSDRIEEFDEFRDYNCDGLTSTKSNLAFAIRTADCLPIILLDGERFFAIHAGWRGLVNNILFSSQKFTSFSNETIAIIGPHIDTKNFEVGSEVCEEATSTLRKNKINFEENVLFLEHSSPQKKYLNLSYFAELQLCALNINKSNIFQTKVDTYRDRSWHSYRRDGSNAGRNIHLVLKC